MKQDDFGDRMKDYEKVFTSTKIDPSQYMCVRIDGKGFSKFTKGFNKPFDGRVTNAMITTTKALVKETHASVGYTQSDEITLIYPPTEGERMFDGKVAKINSVFASIATAHFNNHIRAHVDKFAYFDCRVWSVPDAVEASNVLLWRVQDARKNSISSLMRWTCGHKRMANLSGKQMIDVMQVEKNVDWHDLPNLWKYGTYVKPTTYETYMTDKEMEDIPEGKKPIGVPITRTKIENVDIGYFGDLELEKRMNFVK